MFCLGWLAGGGEDLIEPLVVKAVRSSALLLQQIRAVPRGCTATVDTSHSGEIYPHQMNIRSPSLVYSLSFSTLCDGDILG